jgi:hypothetical protein
MHPSSSSSELEPATTARQVPQLSLIVTVCEGRRAFGRLLADLEAQRDPPLIELVVIDTTDALEESDLPAQERFSSATLLRAPGLDVSIARAHGFQRARAPLVAFTEDHCRLPTTWCARLLESFSQGHLALAGPVGIGGFRAAPDWAAFLIEFSAFMPGTRPPGRSGFSGINCAFERTLVADLIDVALCEPIVYQRLRERGQVVWFDPALELLFERSCSPGEFARHCLASGRTYARLRLAGASHWRRLAYASMASTVLPAVMLARIELHLATCPPALRPPLRSIPWTAGFAFCWGVGEALGALSAAPAQR